MIYCVGNREQKLCKIGHAANPAQRLTILQTACPFTLACFATRRGGKKQETELHQKFHHLHQRGEWFVMTEEIAEYFGFELNPQRRLWAVTLTYGRNIGLAKNYSNEMAAVLATGQDDALDKARQALNLPGYYVSSVCLPIPTEKMIEALALLPANETHL